EREAAARPDGPAGGRRPGHLDAAERAEPGVPDRQLTRLPVHHRPGGAAPGIGRLGGAGGPDGRPGGPDADRAERPWLPRPAPRTLELLATVDSGLPGH